MENEVKTLKGWKESTAETFDEYFPIRCKVDEALVDYMRDILPPRRDSFGILQVGEASDCKIDSTTGYYRTTYATFYKTEDQWYYAGNCFLNEIINRN